MNNEDMKNSSKDCGQWAFAPSPLRSALNLIDGMPTMIDQQIRRVYEESRRSEDTLMETARMTGALHGEVGVALVYRRGWVIPRLK